MNKEKLIMALKRAIWTMAQVALSMLTIGMAVSDVDWKQMISVTLVAGLYSLLKSIIISMPEAAVDGTLVINDDAVDKTSWVLNVDTD